MDINETLFYESAKYFTHTIRWDRYDNYYRFYQGNYSKYKYQDSGDPVTSFTLKMLRSKGKIDLTKSGWRYILDSEKTGWRSILDK